MLGWAGALAPLGTRWWHVHPDYLPDEVWDVVRIASAWRDGVLPDPGGLNDQAARTAAAVQVVLGTWGALEADRLKKLKSNR